jgi:hypothetical protein
MVYLSLHPVAFLQISRYHLLVRPVVSHLQDNQVDQVRVQGLHWDKDLRRDLVDRLVREETGGERYRRQGGDFRTLIRRRLWRIQDTLVYIMKRNQSIGYPDQKLCKR